MSCNFHDNFRLPAQNLTLCIRETLVGYFYSVDHNEMPHIAAFHHGLHCYGIYDLKKKKCNIF